MHNLISTHHINILFDIYLQGNLQVDFGLLDRELELLHWDV